MHTTILLAESSDDQRKTLADYLEHHLPNVTITSVSSSAQATLRWPDADLIVTAQRLAPGSGVELVQHIRAHDPARPILLYTADDAVERAALAAGATRFLRKGSLHELLAAVRELLDLLSQGERVAQPHYAAR